MTQPTALPSSEELLGQIRALCAESIGCPVDLITDDADLEADLGVDSLSQVELLETLLQRYGLYESRRNIQPGAYPTIADLANLIERLYEC
jgi:[acyl-carrier-protein] S-malonyltransferase